MPLTIRSARVGPAWVLELEGGLDSTTADKLDEQLQAALDAGETFVVFDLGRADYVSSAGLRVFMLARQRLRGGGRVCFAGLAPGVRKVFEVVGVLPRVEVFETVADAVAGQG